MESRRRLQFSLASFLWLVFAVACFFAGKHFDDLAELANLRKNQQNNRVEILVGNSRTINTSTRIPTVLIDDPSICDIKVLSPTSIQILAKKPGPVSISLIDEAGVETEHRFEVSGNSRQ